MQTNIETVTIRNMEPQDVDGIINIEQQAYGDHHWSKASFLSEISNELARYYSLFNSEGELCGYAGCWHILDEVHITNIAVSSNCRRRKYGEALLKRLIDDCYAAKNKIHYARSKSQQHCSNQFIYKIRIQFILEQERAITKTTTKMP